VFQRTGDVCLCRQAGPIMLTGAQERGRTALFRVG